MNELKTIGKGMQADIILHKGKALKMMHDKPIEDAKREAEKQQYAYDVGLPVPAIHRVYELGSNACILMDYIKGDTLGEAQMKDPEHTAQYMRCLVDLQLKIHQVDGGNLIPFNQRFQDEIKYANLSRRIKKKYIRKVKHLQYEKCLCHFDYHPRNIILTEDGEPYIIDWTNACVGSRMADVCNTYLIFVDIGQKEMAEYYLSTYCTSANITKEEVLQWSGIIACLKLAEHLPEEVNKSLLAIVKNEMPKTSILHFFRRKKNK